EARAGGPPGFLILPRELLEELAQGVRVEGSLLCGTAAREARARLQPLHVERQFREQSRRMEGGADLTEGLLALERPRDGAREQEPDRDLRVQARIGEGCGTLCQQTALQGVEYMQVGELILGAFQRVDP